jgi:hypothetical protein
MARGRSIIMSYTIPLQNTEKASTFRQTPLLNIKDII